MVDEKPQINVHLVWDRSGEPLHEFGGGSSGAVKNSMTAAEQCREIKVFFQDGDSESFLVTPIGAGLYRMEESSVFCEARYLDTIEAEPQTDGKLRFVRVVTPSGLRTGSYILSPAQVESPALNALLDKVLAAGGNWEKVFGGVLFLHLPPEHAHIIDEFDSFILQQAGTIRDR
jgi:hypothetical protein